jgi:hypothetical protein
MSRLAGEPVLAAARVNIAGVITYRGLAVFIMIGSAVSLWVKSSDVGLLGFIFAFGVQYVAWAGLRPRGGPLQFGIAGGVVGVSAGTRTPPSWRCSEAMRWISLWLHLRPGSGVTWTIRKGE